MRRISLLCVTCAAAMMVAGGCASMSGTLKGGLIGGASLKPNDFAAIVDAATKG